MSLGVSCKRCPDSPLASGVRPELTCTSFLSPGSSWIQRHGGPRWRRWVTSKSVLGTSTYLLHAGAPGAAKRWDTAPPEAFSLTWIPVCPSCQGEEGPRGPPGRAGEKGDVVSPQAPLVQSGLLGSTGQDWAAPKPCAGARVCGYLVQGSTLCPALTAALAPSPPNPACLSIKFRLWERP